MPLTSPGVASHLPCKWRGCGLASGRGGQASGGSDRTWSSVSTSPSRSCRVASATTPTPRSRAVALVTGPIETPADAREVAPGKRLGEARHGRRRRERDGVGGEHALGVARQRGERAVERHDVDLGAGGAQAVGQRVARLLGARHERARRRGRTAAPRAGPLRASARRRRRRRCRPRAGPRRCRARSPRPSRRRARAHRRRSARAAGAGRSATSRRRARRRRRRSAGRASGSMRMTAHSSTSAPRSRRRATRPLACARARVTTMRRPCSGRGSAHASSSRSAATAPITVTAASGSRPPRRRRRSSRACRRRCAARRSCPTASRTRASRAPCRPRSARRPPGARRATPMSTTSVPGRPASAAQSTSARGLPGRSCAVTIVTCAARSRCVTGTPA